MNLKIKRSPITLNPSTEELSQALKKEDQYSIDTINWDEYSYKPLVNFAALYDEEFLYIRFSVEEQEVRMISDTDHQNIWEDSCVEIFIEDHNLNYYNFEFNPKGKCYAAFGSSVVSTRIPLNATQMSEIIRMPSEVERKDSNNFSWSLIIGIPFSIIGRKNDNRYKVNLYKCGDKLKIPHFVSFAPINTEYPNFHVPECFTEIKLA